MIHIYILYKKEKYRKSQLLTIFINRYLCSNKNLPQTTVFFFVFCFLIFLLNNNEQFMVAVRRCPPTPEVASDISHRFVA